MFLTAQRIHRHVNTAAFKLKLEALDADTINQINKAVEDQDLELIIKLGSRTTRLETLSFNALRAKAKAMNIKYWHTMRKPQLVEEIKKCKNI